MIATRLKPLLRECDTNKLNLSDNIVIERIFQYGEISDIRLLLQEVPTQLLQQKLKTIRDHFDSKTQQFIKVLVPINLDHKSHKDDNLWIKNIPTRSIRGSKIEIK